MGRSEQGSTQENISTVITFILEQQYFSEHRSAYPEAELNNVSKKMLRSYQKRMNSNVNYANKTSANMKNHPLDSKHNNKKLSQDRSERCFGVVHMGFLFIFELT